MSKFALGEEKEAYTLKISDSNISNVDTFIKRNCGQELK